MDPVSLDGVHEATLANLADLVSSMAASTKYEAQVLEQLALGHQTYVSAVRALLTGTELPTLPNPGDGGAIALGPSLALSTVNNFGQMLAAGAQSLAALSTAHVGELEGIRNKEGEEKE
jgi:hypothetical protein